MLIFMVLRDLAERPNLTQTQWYRSTGVAGTNGCFFREEHLALLKNVSEILNPGLSGATLEVLVIFARESEGLQLR